jgi:hypothetical protein
MSFSRVRKSRGFSIAGAFVLIALLILAAVAIQSTIPAVTSPASMSAATAGSADLSSDPTVGAGVVASQQSATDAAVKTISGQQTTAPVVAGKDQITILVTGQAPQAIYFPVCPQTPPDQTPKMKALAQQLQSKFPGSKFGIQQGRCKDDPNSKTTPKRQIPIDPSAAKWPQWTLTCYEGNTSGAAVSGQLLSTKVSEMTDQMVDMVPQVEAIPGITCRMDAPGTVTGAKTPQQIQSLAKSLANTADPAARAQVLQGLNPADQSALNQALTDQKTAITQQQQSLASDNAQYSQQLQKIADGSDPCAAQTSADANANSQNAALGEVADTYACQQKAADLNQKIAANNAQMQQFDKQLSNLAAAQVGLKPAGAPPGQIPLTQPPPPPPPPYYGQSTGNGFGNPSLGANNTPQSPFGGACVQRYVCSGNMLYYQSPSPYMGMYGASTAGQCITQPVQQCQYGCMAVNGINGTNGTQSSFLSDFGSGLQIASQIMRAFGGGGANNTVNPNLASQCAMTPQQSQNPPPSPFGNGTNGQPCYQPPQQPDPSQCTSGTWQPTSSSQNGCTTGWQCVPNGNNPANNPPTAQLSCQPKIVDVGMPISFSFSCGNASGSTGTGFSTGGALSGATTTPAPTPPSGSNQATYTLTCVNQGVTASAQCQVQLNKSGIVLVTNPRKVNSGEASLIGWISAGMQSCVVSSPDDQDFTARNAGNTSVNGAATTSPITATTRFQLDCQTLSGGTKSATTSVSIN